jgi:hypothetical protein
MKTCTKCGKSEPEITFKAQRRQCVECRRKYMQGYLKTYGPMYRASKKSDKQVQEPGVPRNSVLIPKWWHVLVGTMPDQQVAQKAGVYKTTVGSYRSAAGISKFSQVRDKVIEEIAKCELVCCICHRLRTHSRRNTQQRAA